MKNLQIIKDKKRLEGFGKIYELGERETMKCKHLLKAILEWKM